MSLYLFEVVPRQTDRAAVDRLLADIDRSAGRASAEVIEFQVAEHNARVFVVVEAAHPVALADLAPSVAELRGPDPVRLVGAELSEVKAAARTSPNYLVEWDLPAGLDMDEYLARKKANAPRYADVPEVSFLRTYVREDMAKCLCLYDAPEEHLVRKARDAVETPVDRLHALRPPEPTP
jgi:hypothetical protein